MAEALRANIDWKSAFAPTGSFGPKISGSRSHPHQPFLLSKTRMNHISCGIRMWAQISFVLSQCTRLTNCYDLSSLKIMTNRYQDFSYNYIHNLYTQNITYTIERHGESEKNTHTVLSLAVIVTDTTLRRWQNRPVWRKNSAVHAPHNIIMNILSCTRSIQSWKSSTRDRTSVADSYHHYSNSGKLPTTDIFAHAFQHATAIIQTTKLQQVYSTLSRHQLWPRTCSLCHVTH